MSVAGMVRFKGAAVTFTLANPGTHSPTTGRFATPSTSTVAGYAMRVHGDPERYRALELIESEAPTLEFVPTTAGEIPALGATVSWSSTTYTVKDVQPIAYNGTASRCRVVIAR